MGLDTSGNSHSSDNASKKNNTLRARLLAAGFSLATLAGCAEDAKHLDVTSIPGADALQEETKERIQTHLNEVESALAKNTANGDTESPEMKIGFSAEDLKKANDASKIYMTKGGLVFEKTKPEEKARAKKPDYNTLTNSAASDPFLKATNPSPDAVDMGAISSVAGDMGKIVKELFGDGVTTGVEYSRLYGVTLKTRIIRNFDDTSSVLLQGKIGPNQMEFLAGLGIKIREDTFGNIFIEHLEQNREQSELKKKYRVSQDKIGVGLKIITDNAIVKAVDGKFTFSQSYDKNIGETNVVMDTDTFFKQYLRKWTFSGVQEMAATIGTTVHIGDHGELITTIGATQTKYNDGSDTQIRASGGVRYTHYMGKDGKWYVEVQRMGQMTMAEAGYQRDIPVSQKWNPSAKIWIRETFGPNANNNDTVGILDFTVPFGDSPAKPYDRPKQGGAGDMAYYMNAWADQFQASTVLGKVIHTDELQVYIKKAALSAWDKINKNEDGTIKNLTFDNGWFTVTSIDGINEVSYRPFLGVVWGQLAIVDFIWLNNQLKAEGLQTGAVKNLRVSVNDASGLSVYNINITKWSAEITTSTDRAHKVTQPQATAFRNGIKTIADINKENANVDTTAPLTVTPPAISVAPTDTTASVTQMINENGTGYFLILPATSPAPSVAAVMAGTAFPMTGGAAKQVNITGMTSSTDYVYYFVAKDTAGTPPNVQATVSSLAIRTTVAPAGPDITLPVATADSASTPFNTALTGINILANDTDNSGVAPTLTGVLSNQVGGTFTANIGAGTIDFTPTSGFTGAASVTYEITDGSGNKDTVPLTVTVGAAPPPSNSAPTASDYAYPTVVWNSAKTFDWLTVTGAADANGDTLTATVITDGTKWAATISGNNITYTPGANKSWSDTVIIRISDGHGWSVDKTISLSGIDSILPVATADSTSTPFNTALIGINILANDTDNSGVAPTLTGVLSNQVGGTFTANIGAGTIDFTPTSGFTGAASVTYEITDGSGNKSTEALTITVSAAPVTTPTAFTFVDQTNSPLSTVTESTAITVAGINTASAISVSGGEYQINGGSWVTGAGTVNNGDTVKVRHTTSVTNSTAVNTTLTIGWVSDIFTTTTLADAIPPNTPTLTLNGWSSFTNTTTFPSAITNDTDNVGVTGWYVSESSSTPALSSFGAEETTTTVSAGDGLKTVYYWTRDAAGNISLVGSSTITLDTVTPNASAWTLWVTAKSTAYTGRKVTLAVWPSGISPTGLSVSSANGWAITNVSVSGGVVTFDYNTGAAPGDDITISGTSGSWVSFTEIISTPALN